MSPVTTSSARSMVGHGRTSRCRRRPAAACRRTCRRDARSSTSCERSTVPAMRVRGGPAPGSTCVSPPSERRRSTTRAPGARARRRSISAGGSGRRAPGERPRRSPSRQPGRLDRSAWPDPGLGADLGRWQGGRHGQPVPVGRPVTSSRLHVCLLEHGPASHHHPRARDRRASTRVGRWVRGRRHRQRTAGPRRGRRHRIVCQHRRLGDDAAARADPGHRVRGRRQRLRVRDGRRVRELLRPDLGPLQGPDAPGARQPRVQVGRGRPVLRVLRIAARAIRARAGTRTTSGPGASTASTRTARASAAAGQVRRRRRGCGRTSPRTRGSVSLLSGTTRSSARAPTGTTPRRALCGRRCTRPAPMSSSPATTMTTSDSRSSAPTAAPTRRLASASSWSGRAARARGHSDRPRPIRRSARPACSGVLKLELRSSSYTWRFVPVSGSTWTDTGAADCH